MDDKQQKLEALGRNFQRALDGAGMRAADLVRELRVTHQTVGNWKKRGVSAKYAPAVASRLGVKPSQIALLTESGDWAAQLWPAVAVHAEAEQAVVDGGTYSQTVEQEVVAPTGGNLSRKRYLIDLISRADLSKDDLRMLEDLVERLCKVY